MRSRHVDIVSISQGGREGVVEDMGTGESLGGFQTNYVLRHKVWRDTGFQGQRELPEHSLGEKWWGVCCQDEVIPRIALLSCVQGHREASKEANSKVLEKSLAGSGVMGRKEV